MRDSGANKRFRSREFWRLRLTSSAIEEVRVIESLFSSLLQASDFSLDGEWDLISLQTFKAEHHALYDLADFVKNQLVKTGRNDWHIWVWPLPPPDQHLSVMRSLRLPSASRLPEELSVIEFVDVHSQLTGRTGIEILRFDEFVGMWARAAEEHSLVVTASISRAMVEAAAALYSWTGQIVHQWRKTKSASGHIHETETGRTVDRDRALQSHELRSLLWNWRYQSRFEGQSAEDLSLSLVEWRDEEEVEYLKAQGVELLDFGAAPKPVSPMALVRDLSKIVSWRREPGSVLEDYGILCNVVHPSLGAFALRSSPTEPSEFMAFSFNRLGRRAGERYSRRDGKVRDLIDDPLPYRRIERSIVRSMIVASEVYLTCLRSLLAVADDIALSAGVEGFSSHRTWRYPPQSTSQCQCLWRQFEGHCNHAWGDQTPELPSRFDM